MRPSFPLLRSLLTAAALASLPPALCAAPTSATSDSPTTSAYTNQPTQLPPPINDYSRGTISSFDYGNMSGFSSNTSLYSYAPLNYFYFPPTPPPLGAIIPRRSTFTFSSFGNRPFPGVSIAPQISPYIGENFYPPLATHLHHEDLSKKQHQRLAAYREARAEIVSALRAKLESVRDSDAPARERELASFAQQQAARFDALEQEAEAIRIDLERGGFFKTSVDWDDWDANRSWRLGDNLRYESRVDEFKVIRAASYFYPNLIPAQRRLLQELALELNEPLANPTADIALDAPDAFFYFSPETARVRLPKNLPDDLSAKIAAYQNEKSALKEELRSAIYKLDRSFFNFTRKNTLNPLAEQQAPRIAALENLAEEIRRGLVALPNPSRPHRPAVSNELSARMAAYMRARQTVLHSLQQRMAAAQKAFPTARVEYGRVGDAYKITLIPSRQQSRSEAQALPAFQAALATFNEEQAREFAALNRTKAELRADVARAASGSAAAPGAAVNDRAVDLMIKKFAAEYEDSERWEHYRDYDTAVFEPGLSPAQRRLLFAAALQQLDLPIPGGSRQP